MLLSWIVMAHWRMSRLNPLSQPFVKCNVRRKPPRDWLHEREVEAMITAAGRNRYPDRDKALILICYRQDLRVGELVALEWAHIDFQSGLLVVRRSKQG